MTRSEPQLPLSFGTERWISRQGWQFDPQSNLWKLSRDVSISLDWTSTFLGGPLLTGFRRVLARYAVDMADHTARNMNHRFKRLVKHALQGRGSGNVLHEITPEVVLSYRSTLDPSREYLLGGLVGFLKRWVEWEEPGVEESVLRALGEMRLRGNKKGEAVALKDPEEGPLSDLEYEALHLALVDGFESGRVALPDYALVLLLMVTGRRPSQIGDLKCSDLVEGVAADASAAFVLNVPRKKQRGVGWREAFKPVALTVENGALVKAHVEHVHERWMGLGGARSVLEHLPMFPNWKALTRAAHAESGVQAPGAAEMKSDLFHLGRQSITNRLAGVVDSLGVRSERTGKTLSVTSIRLRRTLGTRLAREARYGSLPIATALDHSDTQNVKVYTENVPENVEAINEAVAFQLAPIAQAFSGMLVDQESDADRGDDLTSRIRTDDGKGAGTCGHYGFCGAFAPIACYTCKAFQPWLDGPHEEVLDSLLSHKEQIAEQTKDEVIADILNRTIIAVKQVIELCNRRREELGENG